MKRMIKDNPKGFIEEVSNAILTDEKTKEIVLRGYGDKGENIRLTDYCRKCCKKYCNYEISQDVKVENFEEHMDYPKCSNCIVRHLYNLMCGYAMLYGRVEDYEKINAKLVNDIEDVRQILFINLPPSDMISDADDKLINIQCELNQDEEE